MSQHNQVLLAVRRFTRVDFTALRAWLNRLPIERIASLYYCDDDLELLNCSTPNDLRRHLESIRDELIVRAIDANPRLAQSLQDARKNFRWSGTAITFLVQAADQKDKQPRPGDSVSMWLRPVVASRLKAEGANTLGALLQLIQTRGSGWYRPIPRIGKSKADAIVRWLQRHSGSLGVLTPEMLAPSLPRSDRITLDPGSPTLVPLERMHLSEQFSGATGLNRNPTFSLIGAKNDLEAIEAYLYRYRGQEKTHRAYQKELERFLLWCILIRGKAMSSILGEDCEAYKDFLAAPHQAWIGKRAQRFTSGWRPFAGPPSPESQRYAIQALRSFFGWLVSVRYLGGNPWITVASLPVAAPLLPMQIDKALPEALWRKLAETGGLLDCLCATTDDELRVRYKLRGWAATMSMAAQFRLLRATLLLLGCCGLRREEAVQATRNQLKPLKENSGLWELAVLGKRNKWRYVFLPQRTVDAIQDHWRDRLLEQEFDFGMASIPLLAPLIVPATPAAQKKYHLNVTFHSSPPGFTPDSIYQLITRTLRRIARDETLALSQEERGLLQQSGPHAFRHTFGTVAAANDVPIDVLQKILGHASLQTTTIYIQAEKTRAIHEIGKLYGKVFNPSAEK